jgi:organic radical activating enzyme
MEVFASIQGEGAYVGEPQVFLRLRGCPLRCRWCDTPASWRLSAGDRARIDAGTQSRREPAWATPFQAACWIAEVEPGSPRTVSVTGGEPLMWPRFLLGLKPMLGARRVHLETAGAHPRRLASVIDAFDHVSLDLKPELDLDEPEELTASELSGDVASPLAGSMANQLAGSVASQRARGAASELAGGAPGDERAPRTRDEWRAARRASLALVGGRDACAKIVVSGERTVDELAPLLDEVEACAPTVPVYLQPATPVNGVRRPTNETLEALCEMARDRGLSARVLPQVHRALRMP